jgi:hypothetical protein
MGLDSFFPATRQCLGCLERIAAVQNEATVPNRLEFDLGGSRTTEFQRYRPKTQAVPHELAR